MTLRVLFAGALAALPLLVSGALAQTAATPPAATTSPAPSATPASPRRRDDVSRAARIDPGKSDRSAHEPARSDATSDRRPRRQAAPTRGLVSPFMPQARRRRRRGLIRRPTLPRPRLRPFPRARPRRRQSRRKSRRLRRRARPRSATILAQPFSPTPSSPPPRRPSAIRRSWTRAAGRPTSPRSAPERRARRS